MMAAAQSPATAPLCLQYLEALSAMKHLPSIFLPKLGRAWRPAKLPRTVPRGQVKLCYMNAGQLALESKDLTYVEGYACPPGLIPVHHGWCVTPSGEVVDPTFEDAEASQYYGVALSKRFVRQACEDSGVWGIFAGMMTPELFMQGLADVQAGPWAASDQAAGQFEALLRPRLLRAGTDTRSAKVR